MGIFLDDEDEEEKSEKKTGAQAGYWFWIRLALCVYVGYIGIGLVRDGLNEDVNTWYAVGGGAFIAIALGIVINDLRYYFRQHGKIKNKEDDVDVDLDIKEDISAKENTDEFTDSENNSMEKIEEIDGNVVDEAVGDLGKKKIDDVRSIGAIAKYTVDDTANIE